MDSKLFCKKCRVESGLCGNCRTIAQLHNVAILARDYGWVDTLHWDEDGLRSITVIRNNLNTDAELLNLAGIDKKILVELEKLDSNQIAKQIKIARLSAMRKQVAELEEELNETNIK